MTRIELMNYAQQTYYKALSTHKFNRYERLNTCQAHYIDIGNVVILKSYNTVVAIYNKTVGSLYVFDYYSVTTQSHISKFVHMLDWDRIVYLYKRSDNVLERYLGSNGMLKEYKVSGIARYKLETVDYSLEITNRWD